MVDFIVDGSNKLLIEPPGTGNTQFDVARDLYSAWKRWVTLSDNAKFEQAFLVEGGTPIGATGLFTGTTFILTNGWKVRGADHDHQLLLNGNIYSDDGIVTSANPNFNVEVLINASVAAQGVSSGSGLSATQEAKLDELWRLQGLDAANPMIVTPTSRVAGDVIQAISGDGETTSTVTRQ